LFVSTATCTAPSLFITTSDTIPLSLSLIKLLQEDSDAKSEPHSTIEFEDIEPETFIAFLKTVYDPNINVATNENVRELLLLATRFEYVAMQQSCTRFMMAGMSTKNVLSMFVSTPAGLETERKRIIAYLAGNIKDVMQQDSWLEVKKNTIKEILGLKELRASEAELFQGVYNWAKAQYFREHPDVADQEQSVPGDLIREVMSDVLDQLRLPAMNARGFAAIVVPTGILTQDETLQLFVHIGSGVCSSIHTIGLFCLLSVLYCTVLYCTVLYCMVSLSD
jgi:BTB/POZ domain-containing protein 3/6